MDVPSCARKGFRYTARDMLPFDEVAARLRDAEVGRGTFVATPFGRRLITYADLTATGRSLAFVEARRWPGSGRCTPTPTPPSPPPAGS